MKTLAISVSALCISLTLTACGGKSEDQAADATVEQSTPVQQAEQAAPAMESMPVQEAAPVAQETPAQEAPSMTQADSPEEKAEAPVAAASAADGEGVYKGLCFSCHDAGIAGAPKLGDQAAWEPRLALGMDSLYETTIKGKGAMPAKGGNPALSDEEVKAAVDYMIAQSK